MNFRILTIYLAFYLSLGHYPAIAQMEPNIELSKTIWKLGDLMKEIEDRSGKTFAYGVLDKTKVIRLSSKELSLEQMLREAFAGESIHFRIVKDKILIIKRKPEQAEKSTFNGYIFDQRTGEAIIGATVYDTLNKTGTVTNVYGFFSYSKKSYLDIPMVVSSVGYKDTLIWVTPGSTTSIDVRLHESNSELEEVVIETQRVQDTQMSIATISPKDVQKLPTFMGEPDLLKTITLMPGIKFGSDNSSGFYVRGGGPDQNLILLDGANIYNATHAFDLFSTFNTSAVKQIDVIKGGFPARYSGRLSSVLDVRMKEGNTQKFTGELGMGYLLSKFTAEGPLFSDQTSFLVSGRRTFLDLIFKMVGDFDPAEENELRQDIVFQDISAKINHRFSERDQLYFSYYGSGDQISVFESENQQTGSTDFGSSTDVDVGWSNRVFSGRWNHLINERLFLNTTTTYTNFDIKIDLLSKESYNQGDERITNDYGNSFASQIKDYGIHVHFDYFPSVDHQVKFGINGTYHDFRPGVSSITTESTNFDGNIDTLFDAQKTHSIEFSGFVEDEITMTARLKANVGFHAASLSVENKNYLSLQPRLALSYKISNGLNASLSYSEMAQFIHLLTNSTLGIPLDLWVPATPDAPPMQSRQVAAGIAYNPTRAYSLSFETYYKTMKNLIAYKEGARFTNAQETWQSKIENDGSGDAYGFEIFAKKNLGKTTGWLGYTLSWTNRRFDNLNRGETYPYKYDRRHDISAVIMHEFGPKLNISSSWIFATGNAVSFPYASHINAQPIPSLGDQAIYNSSNPGQSVEVFAGRNSVRMPNYHRLDIGINLVKRKKRGVRTWNFSIYNTYVRKNPFMIFVSESDEAYQPVNASRGKELTQVSSFWIIPSFTYNFKFN